MQRFAIMALVLVGCGGREASTTATYEGSWTGLCQHMADCDCSPFPAVDTCSAELEQGYEAGFARAIELGIPPTELEARRMTPDQLREIANTPCPALCEDAAAFSRATGR